MGKALIIKGADFSQIKVETIDIDGKVYISAANALFTKNGYFAGSTISWNPNPDIITGFWPLHNGDVIVVESENIPETQYFAFASVNGNTITGIGWANVAYAKKSKSVLMCTQDCYLATTLVGDNNIAKTLPETMYIADNIDNVDMSINNLNYTVWVDKYIKADGSFGGGSTNYGYAVIAGETVKITTDLHYTTIFLLAKNITTNDTGYITDTASSLASKVIPIDENVRKQIGANSEKTITIPNNGYLCILKEDAGTDLFPKSVEVSFE